MKKNIILFISFFVVAFAGIYYHTNTLTVSHHEAILSKSGKKLKIAHISDLHTKGLGRLEQQLFEELAIEKPDLIVITGDVATPAGTPKGYRDVLRELKAPKGVFFVPGNWEYWEPIPNLSKMLHELQIIDLKNNVKEIDSGLWLIGFDDGEEGQPDLKILQSIPLSHHKISIFHSPSFFDRIATKISLNFAGHSHGGQIRIPFVESTWVPKGTEDYVQGWYVKEYSKLFISRGIGTSILPIRFNCSPELAIIEVKY